MDKNKIYLIANSHIDPVWQWRWTDGFSEIKATFKSVLERMNEYPDLKFTCACGVYYEWIEKSCPEMFNEIKKRIKEGRWCIAGGWFLQPDCNLLSGESFVRHALITQRYFKEKFGKYAEIGYNVDSFGHNGALPQILKKSGLKGYVFMRPGIEENKKVPANFFVWRGIDGSEIPTYRVPVSYCLKGDETERFFKIAEEENADQMLFCGIGNHGGGPSMKMIEDYLAEIKSGKNVTFSTVNEFFNDHPTENLHVYCYDLQFHARGASSANSEIKEMNCTAEAALYEAEVYSTMSFALADTPYPSKKYKKAWKNVLFNQFHDIMAGCAIKSAYKDAKYLFGETMSIAEQEINFALQQISWQIDTLKGKTDKYFRKSTFFPFVHNELGSPVVVFNPLPFKRTVAVKIFPTASRVEDENGNALKIQHVRGEQTDGNNIFNTLILTELPACGYKTVRIFSDETKITRKFPKSAFLLENDYIKVSFDDKSGEITSFYDKKAGREILSAPAENCVFSDKGYDTWAHGVYAFDNLNGKFGSAKFSVLEDGDILTALRVTVKYKKSVLRQDYILYKNSPVLTVKAHVEMLERKTMLRLKFPVAGDDVVSATEVPFGVITHPRDKAEYPCGKWFTLGDNHGGLTVLTKYKSSYGVDDKTAYFTVLRTTAYLDHFGKIDEFCDYQDDGIQEFEYALAPFVSYAENEVIAAEFITQPRAVLETFHKGSLKTEYSGAEVIKGSVFISAIKRAEDGNGFIVRIFETAGCATEAVVDIKCLNIVIKTTLKKYEIKTFKIAGSVITECDLIENEI